MPAPGTLDIMTRRSKVPSLALPGIATLHSDTVAVFALRCASTLDQWQRGELVRSETLRLLLAELNDLADQTPSLDELELGLPPRSHRLPTTLSPQSIDPDLELHLNVHFGLDAPGCSQSLSDVLPNHIRQLGASLDDGTDDDARDLIGCIALIAELFTY